MKTKVMLLATIALLAPLLFAAACGGGGGGGDEEAGIRTQKGLGVAALAAAAGQGGDEADSGSDTGIAPGAPSAGTAVGIERGGVIAPDFFPFPYPSLQESQTGITVQGFGSASVDADSAIMEFYFGGEVTGIKPVPGLDGAEPSSGGGVAPVAPEPQAEGQAQPITEADLQPVVDAIAAQGVSAADIEVIVQPSYGDPYYGGSATIRATVRNIGAVDAIVKAATEAASGLAGISLQATNVTYTVSDCAALERAAMQAAVEDARERGQTFASALGVGLGAVLGASHYSYSPFGSPCDSQYVGPYPLAGVAYAEGQATEVQLVATVTITFAIQ